MKSEKQEFEFDKIEDGFTLHINIFNDLINKYKNQSQSR